MMTDTGKLNAAIQRSGLKKAYIAEKLGISKAALWMKMTGKRDFKTSEIRILKDLLNLTPKEVVEIFLPKK